jgi:hypothetical protein
MPREKRAGLTRALYVLPSRQKRAGLTLTGKVHSGGGRGSGSEDMRQARMTHVLILILVLALFAMASWACSSMANLKTPTRGGSQVAPTNMGRPTNTAVFSATIVPTSTPSE